MTLPKQFSGGTPADRSRSVGWGDAPGRLRATAVIVLYGMAPEESPAFRSLIEARTKIRADQANVSIVIWDNSPSWQFSHHLPNDVFYCHDPRNPGLATAYNHAVEIAIQQRSQWLITLDQDTTVPPDYLLRMTAAAQLCASRPDVGAIVPQIAIGPKRLSPYRFALGAIPRWYRPGFCGIPGEPVFALNSGAMIRVEALQQIGGYDQRFTLDHSDSVVFRNLHRYGKRVYIEGGIQLGHELSLIGKNLSKERYRRALIAESAFWDLHMNWLAGCERTLRLLLRSSRHWVRGDRSDLRRVTKHFLYLRIFRSRKARLRRWRESLDRRRQPGRALEQNVRPRPKVSVCMSAFNGARFVQAQLESILPQLSPDDEVVIVDDSSRDQTVARVLSLDDRRIRLLGHERNEGVVASFEDALRCATGEILFLSDDDDLWHPSKVEKILREFDRHQDVNVVTSRVALIDEWGDPLPDAPVNRYGRFFPGFWRNILKNHYQGSAMAIRASLLGSILPFPRAGLFLHDVWIGTRNEALRGKTAFIDEPLVYYRRHDRNLSRAHGLLKRIQLRIELLIAHIAYAARKTRADSLTR
jgi:glycosyltransferase involved in cell wall biosynthesis